jgi:hypothetical protein
MTPAFLHEVSARQIYANCENFVKLWQHKAQLAEGRPWKADDDISNTFLDIIFATTFGLDPRDSNVVAQLALLESSAVQVPPSRDEPVVFPHARRPKSFDAMTTLIESLATSIQSPVPRFAHWVLRQMPYMRRARAEKEKLMTEMVNKSVQRVTSGKAERRSALDDIILREAAAAAKEKRRPVYNSRTIYDEVRDPVGEILCGY